MSTSASVSRRRSSTVSVRSAGGSGAAATHAFPAWCPQRGRQIRPREYGAHRRADGRKADEQMTENRPTPSVANFDSSDRFSAVSGCSLHAIRELCFG
jgi:hypothetical protein